MSILQNAIDSIAIGLEDYESTDDRRIVSSTRNIFAGILLLFKHKLCELSPQGTDEALIKQRVLPTIDSTGAVNWIGKGAKTVDVFNIEERFKSLNIVVDWTRLKKINKASPFGIILRTIGAVHKKKYQKIIPKNVPCEAFCFRDAR